MNLKRVLSLTVCVAMLFGCTACNNNSVTSDYSSTITVIYEESEIIDNTSSQVESNFSSVPSVESIVPDIPPVSEEEVESNKTGYEYVFDHIETVDYFCVKNIPQSDIVYVVTDVIADTKQDISIGCQLFCDDPKVKITNKTITIPYEYKKQNKLVTITVRYSLTGQNYKLTIPYENDWPMIWEDEFNGSEIDFTKWDYRPDWLRDKGYVNYWDRSTMFVDGNGNLVSRATPGKKVVHGKEIDAYLSGAISTKGLFESTYGYYEARVKLHHQTGMWGAFWLICGDMDSSTPADDNLSINGCEIDVFESIFPEGGVAQNLHWDGFTGHTGSAPSAGYVTQINTYDNQYHDFAISWTPNEYVFLIDGIVTRRINAKTAGGICNQPGYMIISTECGPWAGKWVLGEGEYSDMLVDYVRVYQYPSDK